MGGYSQRRTHAHRVGGLVIVNAYVQLHQTIENLVHVLLTL